MWSVEATARRSVLTGAQRVVFSVSDGTEATKRQLVRVLAGGQCKALALPDAADAAALRLVRSVVESRSAGNHGAAWNQLAILAATPAACGAGTLRHVVENALATMRTGQIDVLLLDSRTLSLPPAHSHSLSARKRVLVEYWEQMLLLRDAGMVRHVGASDFTIQDVELVVSSFPSDPPVVLAVHAGVSQATTSARHPAAATKLVTYTSFAHGIGVDVLVRFSFSQLDDLPLVPRERWKQVWEGIAQQHATTTFHHLVTHETEKSAEFHVEARVASQLHPNEAESTDRDGSDDEPRPLGSAPLVVLRYFLQRGLAVIPLLNSIERGENNGGGDAMDAIFGDAIHPFASLHPAFSPHKVFASVLTDAELKAVESMLPFTALDQSDEQSEEDPS